MEANIEAVAEALWRHRASSEELDWGKKTWPEFKRSRPSIATIYRANAEVAIKAMQGLST